MGKEFIDELSNFGLHFLDGPVRPDHFNSLRVSTGNFQVSSSNPLLERQSLLLEARTARVPFPLERPGQR